MWCCRDLERAVEELSELIESPLEPESIPSLRQKVTDKTVRFGTSTCPMKRSAYHSTHARCMCRRGMRSCWRTRRRASWRVAGRGTPTFRGSIERLNGGRRRGASPIIHSPYSLNVYFCSPFPVISNHCSHPDPCTSYLSGFSPLVSEPSLRNLPFTRTHIHGLFCMDRK